MAEPTYLRSKLGSDIRNRLGIKSVSTNYIQFYINDEFMGLYIMTDVINLPWIEDEYGEKKATNLYECNGIYDLIPEYYNGCENKNEDVNDNTEWINFLSEVENAKSATDLESIFEVEHFLYEMAIDYLVESFDHKVHNFNFYKQPNGKWIYLSDDYDLDLYVSDISELTYEEYFDYFRERLYNILIAQDQERFNNIIKDIVTRVINPDVLYPHIDEIKQFIEPYVIIDKTPDSNGRYPGAINDNSLADKFYHSFEEWDDSLGFTKDVGLKYKILMKYKNICTQLNMECNPMYMDANYLGENDKYIEDYYHTDIDEYNSLTSQYEIPTAIPTEYSTEIPFEIPTEISNFIENETEYDVDIPMPTTDNESSSDEEDTNDLLNLF